MEDDTNKFEECVSVLSKKIKWLKRHDFSDETLFKIDNVDENLVPDRAKKVGKKILTLKSVLYVFNIFMITIFTCFSAYNNDNIFDIQQCF